MTDLQSKNETASLSSIGDMPISDFPTVYRFLVKLDYSQTDHIQRVEQALYQLLKENPDSTIGLILLMQEQIMQGAHQKALSIAYRIWDLGGDLNPALEALYIGNLLNVGLIDMASSLLKAKLENLDEAIPTFLNQIMKYALMSGNIFLLRRIVALEQDIDKKKILQDFCDIFTYLKAEDTFKALQQSITEMLRDVLLGYEYTFYTDRGFTDIEISIYVGDEAGDLEALRQKIEMKITTFCIARKLPRFNNLNYVIRPITEHPSLVSLSQKAL